MFHDGPSAANSAEIAARWVSENLADVEIERQNTWNGDVRVNRAIAEMLEPAHA
jgi:hypothetical protein